jgi:hypothetical protein
MSPDPSSLKIAKEFSLPGIQFCLARKPGTNTLYVGSSDGCVYELDALAEKPEPRALTGHSGYVTGIALAGEHLVSGAYDGRLIWWDLEQRQAGRNVEAHQRWIRGVVANPEGTLLVSVADDMVARVWDAGSGAMVRELRGHQPTTPNHFPSMLYCAAISPDGKHVATADRVGQILVWELDTGKQLAVIEAPLMYTWDPKQRIHSIGGIRSLAFSTDGQLLAAGGIGQIGNIDHLGAAARIEIFDWQKQERTLELETDKFKGLVERLVFDNQGRWLLAAGGDHNGFVQFLDLADQKMVKQEKAPMHVHDLVADESQETLFAVGHGKVVVWTLTG